VKVAKPSWLALLPEVEMRHFGESSLQA